jgi:ABC-2 type transport system ATP-binding protein
LSFRVAEGEIYGLIGPNGAGKTTTLRILSTLILPDSGSARIFNYNVVSEAAEVRKIISYLPEEAGAYKNLSGLEYLRFMAQFYVENKEDLEKRVKEARARICWTPGNKHSTFPSMIFRSGGLKPES